MPIIPTRQHSEASDGITKQLDHGDKLDTINNTIDALIQRYTTATDDDAILKSTELLDHLSYGYATALIIRANAFANKGNLKDAVKDALRAVDCQPESAIGYLTAGNIYTIQGNMQAAMDTYQYGLHTVLPSEWFLLYERWKAVKIQRDQKIDFISRLPVEIATNIFSQLRDDGDTLITCTFVSRYWRECILNQCPELWRTVTITNKAFDSPPPEAQLLFSTSNHVQHLILNDASEHSLDKLIDMAENDKLSSVKDIEIVTLPRLIKRHMALVTQLRRRLTNLSIMLMNYEPDDDQTTFELHSIIRLCPKLQYLYLQTRATVVYHPTQSSYQDQYPLLGLTIRAPRLERRVLEQLIPLCPKLQVLDVYDLTPGTTSLLYQQCTQLRHLAVVDGYHLKGINSIVDDNQDLIGLHSLRYTKGNTTIRKLIPFLSKSNNTLKTLELRIRELDEGSNRLAHLGFSQLTKLNLHMGEEHLPVAASMIQHCPVLEDVALVFGGASVTDEFFASLIMLPRLRNLTLSYICSSSPALGRFFAHLASRYQECKLQTISLKDCDGVTDGVLRALADITTLRKIVLHYLHDVGIRRNVSDH
ncbi:hypothetical protein BJV82DRAFT_674653 [Fennellomyces sp. T-0311]|nr:hypothetical protein BJV82DRAFT_674653 [Fennellomyces sp. T-0311]